MEKSGRVVLASLFLFFCPLIAPYSGPSPLNAGQAKTPPAKGASKRSPDSSLDFLGTYSAPNAVLATETGHTSAHPPSPTAAQRLQQIESTSAILPPWPEDLVWPARALEASCSGKGKPNASGGNSLASRQRPVLASAVAQQHTHLPPLIFKADRDIRLRRFADVRPQYEEFLRLHPSCEPAHWNLAVVEAYRNDPRSRNDIRRWLSASPSLQNGKLLASLLNIRAGNPTLAWREISQASKSNSGSRIQPPKAHSRRTLIWARAVAEQFMGNLQQARAGLLQLLPANLNLPEVWYALGSNALADARTASRSLDEIAPHSGWNRKLESEALAGRYPELAREIWPRNIPSPASGKTKPATAAAATDPRFVAKLAPDQALVQARSIAASLDSLESEAVSPQALYARARKSLELAELSFDQSARSSAFEAQMDALRALAAEQEDDEKQAMAIYQKGLKRRPDSAVLHAGLGELYRHRLELPQARQELEEASRLDPGDPLAAYELGDVYERLAEPKRALPPLNQALKLDPGLLLARWSRAKAYLALGNLHRAEMDFKTAAPADPSGEVEWQLSRIYTRLGQPELAREAAQRAEALRKKQAHPQGRRN